VCLGVINTVAARVDTLLLFKTPEDYGYIRISVEAYCVRIHLYQSHFRSIGSTIIGREMQLRAPWSGLLHISTWACP
jgi:hypothetical protein